MHLKQSGISFNIEFWKYPEAITTQPCQKSQETELPSQDAPEITSRAAGSGSVTSSPPARLGLSATVVTACSLLGLTLAYTWEVKNVRLPQACPCYFSRVSQTCRTVERERSCGRQSQHGLLRHRARPVRTGFAAKLGLTKADTMWKEASSWFVGHNNVLQNTSLARPLCFSLQVSPLPGLAITGCVLGLWRKVGAAPRQPLQLLQAVLQQGRHLPARGYEDKGRTRTRTATFNQTDPCRRHKQSSASPTNRARGQALALWESYVQTNSMSRKEICRFNAVDTTEKKLSEVKFTK